MAKTTPRTLLKIVGVVIALAMIGLTAGCGGDDDPPSAKDDGGASSSPKEKTKAQGDGVIYDRPGYDRSKLSQSTGDPMAVKLKPSGGFKLSSGVPILGACSILTLDDLDAVGLHVLANSYGAAVRQSHIIPGRFKGKFAPGLNDVPGTDGTPGCSYALQAPATELSAAAVVTLPSYVVSPGAVTENMDLLDFKKDTPIGGYQHFVRTAKLGYVTHSLRAKDLTIKVVLSGIAIPQAPRLLKAVVANLASLKTSPQGGSKAVYDTPTFEQPYLRACDLVDNADMKELSGADPTPLVEERIRASTGIVDPGATPAEGSKPSDYIRNTCVFHAPDRDADDELLLGSPGDHTLTVTTTSYENPAAAAHGLKSLSIGEDNPSAVHGSGVGEDVSMYKDRDGSMVMAFRQGRVTVELVYDFAFQTGSMEEMATKLSPVADKIVAKVKAFK